MNKRPKRKAAKKPAKWKKSSPQLVERFSKALAKLPEAEVEHRTMFGCPCGFVNGNLFAGLHEEHCVVRLDADERETVMTRHGAGFFEPMGRRMREYASLPPELNVNQRKLNFWVAKAFEYASGLPPKAKKKRKGRTGE